MTGDAGAGGDVTGNAVAGGDVIGNAGAGGDATGNAATPDAGTRAWALLVEYDGAPFNGWQRQARGVSVQHVLEAAAARLARGAAVASVAAGRTDAGVHAEGQVVLVSLPEPAAGPWRCGRLVDALNFHLRPHPVAVRRAAPAPPGWSPRFSAVRRCYRYRILNRRARPALALGRVWHVERALDLDAMREGAAHLRGTHDFTSFRATACQADSPVRTLDRLSIERSTLDPEEVLVWAEARSFLHHQVRNMVGTLALVGAGRWPAHRVRDALSARARASAGPTAPASGLALVEVGYPVCPFARRRPDATVA